MIKIVKKVISIFMLGIISSCSVQDNSTPQEVKSLLKESMITNGEPFIFDTASGATTIRYSTNSTSQATDKTDIIKFTIGSNVIYWNTNLSYTTPDTNLNTIIQVTEAGVSVRMNYTITIVNHKVTKITALDESTKYLGMNIFSTLSGSVRSQFWVRPKGADRDTYVTIFENSDIKKISESDNIITVQLTRGSITNTFPLDTSVVFENKNSNLYNVEYTVNNLKMKIQVRKYSGVPTIIAIYKRES